MNRGFILFATIAGGVAVIAGALLSHQLKATMPTLAQEVFETGVRYQFYHVFALLAVGISSVHLAGRWIRMAGNFFIAGIILFSGSLYVISVLLSKSVSIPMIIGICTPLGGLAFILGWLFFGIAIWKTNRS